MNNPITAQNIDGLLIKCRTKDAKSKEFAAKQLYGWQHAQYTPEKWVKQLEYGYTICVGSFQPDLEGKYSHAKDLWQSTNMVFADGDNFTYEPDATETAIPAWIEADGLLTRFPSLREKAFALSESVSSMSEGKPHRRHRLIFLFDQPITSEADYHKVLLLLAAEYPVIPAVERSPAQPVFGNARKETGEVQILGNELSLEAYLSYEPPSPKPEPEPIPIPVPKPAPEKSLTLDEFIKEHGIATIKPRPKGGHFVECPWKDKHASGKTGDTDSYIWENPDGTFAFNCSHATCKQRGNTTWAAYREAVAPRPIPHTHPTQQQNGGKHYDFAGDPQKWTEDDIETEDPSPQLDEFPSELFFDVFGTYREAHLDRVPMSDAFCFASLKHCISITLGRKYYIDSEPEIFPNFYTALIGDSSDAAKGIALRQQAKMLRSIDPTVHTIKSLTTPAGLVNLFVQPTEKERQGENGETEMYYTGGLADKITDTDFLEDMIANCCNKESFRISCQLGEFRDLLIKSARSTGAGLLELIMDVYDADEVIDSNTKVDASLAKYPTLSMIGGTDKRLIEKALGAEYIGGGLTNRFEWYLGYEVEERFVNQKADSQLWGKAQNVLGNIRNKFDQSPQQVAFTIPSESETLGEDFLKKHKKHLKAIRESEELAADSLRRTKMHVLKNSLIFSVLCNDPKDTVIHPEQMEKAIILAKWTTNATQHIFNDFALGEDSNLKKRLLKLLRSTPRMSASQIGNRLRNENPTKLFQMLEVLTRHEVLIRETPKRTALYSVRKLSSE